MNTISCIVIESRNLINEIPINPRNLPNNPIHISYLEIGIKMYQYIENLPYVLGNPKNTQIFNSRAWESERKRAPNLWGIAFNPPPSLIL